MPFRRRCSITLRLPLSEPAAGNGIFGAGDRRLRATRRDYGADAAASNQLNRQFNSPSGPVRASYFSLSSRRSIFPVAVRGKASMNSTLLGALKAATRSRAQRITSWGSGLLPGFG